MQKIIFISLVFGFFLCGCVPAARPSATATSTLAQPQIRVVSPTPSQTPPPTVTAFPTATPTLFPLSISAMRQGEYPGSDITIVKELVSGSNYRRYYVYYLSQGLKIYALLTVPNGQMPPGGWPGIVFNHGYIPPEIYKTTERYIEYVNQLALNGYVVFRIDYRGHDQSEGQAAGAYGDPGYEVDVLNAVASLKRFEKVNPQKIGMWGHSMGGYLTLRAMVIDKSIKVGVIWAGVVASYPDLLYRWHNTAAMTPTPPPDSRRWRDQWIETYGSPAENPAFWDSISANSYLADLSGPLQLHHGTADEEVPLAFSQTLEAQIKQVGGTVELYTYKDDNHNLSGYFSLAMKLTIAFFDTYLK